MQSQLRVYKLKAKPLFNAFALHINNRRFQNCYNNNSLGATPMTLIKEFDSFVENKYPKQGMPKM